MNWEIIVECYSKLGPWIHKIEHQSLHFGDTTRGVEDAKIYVRLGPANRLTALFEHNQRRQNLHNFVLAVSAFSTANTNQMSTISSARLLQSTFAGSGRKAFASRGPMSSQCLTPLRLRAIPRQPAAPAGFHSSAVRSFKTVEEAKSRYRSGVSSLPHSHFYSIPHCRHIADWSPLCIAFLMESRASFSPFWCRIDILFPHREGENGT